MKSKKSETIETEKESKPFNLFEEIQTRLYGSDWEDHNIKTIETEVKNRANDKKKD